MYIYEEEDAGTFDTQYQIDPGDTFVGEISDFNDDDYVAVQLIEGMTYEITVSTDQNRDIDGRILQPDRGLITWLGETFDYQTETLKFNADETGLFYIASSFGNDTGSYEVTVTELEDTYIGTPEDFVYQLTQEYWDWRGVTAAHWDAEAGDTLTVDITDLDADGRTVARLALETWSEYSGLRFSEVTQGADIVFDDIPDGAYAYTEYEGPYLTFAEINVDPYFLSVDGTDIGGLAYSIYLHEIGHALGLGHSGDYNGDAYYATDAKFINDTTMMTIMSYFDGSEFYQNDVWSDLGQITPMLADILAIESYYGPNEINYGDTVYGLDGTGDSPFAIALASEIGEQKDPNTPVHRNSSATLVDTGGTDTFDFSAYDNNFGDMRLDLRPGATSDLADVPNALVIMPDTIIENVIGSATDDIVIGNLANNFLQGLDGEDWLRGLGGDDSLRGGDGDDRLEGEDGDDLLSGNRGSDLLIGGDGSDRMFGGDNNDTLTGGDDDDDLDGGDGNDRLYGNDGIDKVLGGAGEDRLFGGTDNDTLAGGDDDDDLDGGTGNDLMYGNAGEDTVLGGRGEDRMYGGTDNDTLAGGDDDDNLYGGTGNDRIYGNDGADTLLGEAGEDRLFGGIGNDTLAGGDDNDELDGGTGDDRMFGNDGEDTLNGQAGIDELSGGNNDDTLLGRAGDDTIRGGNDNDLIYAGADDDLVAGNNGDDTLKGGSGDDRLFGGNGNDTVEGGTGSDILSGGDGADIFVFASASDSSSGAARDTISDFSQGDDLIDLSGIMAGLSFIGADAYGGVAGQVRFNDTLGRLYVDTDGDSLSEFSVDVAGNLTLGLSDLVL